MFFFKKRKTKDINFGVMQTPLIGYYFPEDTSKQSEKVNVIATKDDAAFIEIPPRENALGLLAPEFHIAIIGRNFFYSEEEAIAEAERRN